MTKTLFAIAIALAAAIGAANAGPSGALGMMFRTIGQSYGTALQPGDVEIYAARIEGGAFCGIHPFGSDHFVWAGDSSELPVRLTIIDAAVWTLSCIAPSDSQPSVGLLYSLPDTARTALRAADPGLTTDDQAEESPLLEALRQGVRR